MSFLFHSINKLKCMFGLFNYDSFSPSNISPFLYYITYIYPWLPILGVGHRACKKIISRVCCYFLNCGRLQKIFISSQVSGGGYHITYFYWSVTGYHRHCRCRDKYWVSMVSDTSLSYVARNHVLIPYLLCYFPSS